jgi:hypothetical protein
MKDNIVELKPPYCAMGGVSFRVTSNGETLLNSLFLRTKEKISHFIAMKKKRKVENCFALLVFSPL